MKSLDKKVTFLFWGSFLTISAIFGLYLLFPLGILSNKFHFNFFVSAGLLILSLIILSYIFSYFYCKHFSYDFSEDGYHQKSGVFFIRTTFIPYDKITEIDLKEGPLSRALGFVGLNIYSLSGITMTRGFYGPRGRIYLPLDEAIKVQKEVMKRIK